MVKKMFSARKRAAKNVNIKHIGLWTTDETTCGKVAREPLHYQEFDYFEDDHGSVPRKDLNDFFNRTTISGMIQIGTRRSLKWKIFWLIISLSGLAMSLYQSKDVLTDFIGDRTIQSILYRNIRKVPFPSLTLCTNVRITYLKKSTSQEIAEVLCPGGTLEGCFRTGNTNNKFSNFDSDEIEILTELLKLQSNYTSLERMVKFYTKPPLFISNCSWKGTKCDYNNSKIFHFFNNLLRGNCVTFNMGLDTQLDGVENREFVIELAMIRLSRKLKFNFISSSYWVHSAGTAPALHSENAGSMFPGDKLRIEFNIQNHSRTESKSCVSAWKKRYRKQNVYYTDEFPYIYDQAGKFSGVTKCPAKNCIFKMENDEALKRRCYHASVPHHDLYSKLQEEDSNLTVTMDQFRECAGLTDEISDRFREICKPSCSELSVKTSINSISLILENLVEESILEDDNTTKSSERINLAEILRNRTSALLQLTPADNIIEDVIEDYKYSVADFLGILGGNFGLWIGVSVISLAELVELFYMLGRCAREICKLRKEDKDSKLNSAIPLYSIEIKKRENLRQRKAINTFK